MLEKTDISKEHADMKLQLSKTQLEANHQKDSHKVQKAKVEELKRAGCCRRGAAVEVHKEDMKIISSLMTSMEGQIRKMRRRKVGTRKKMGKNMHFYFCNTKHFVACFL